MSEQIQTMAKDLQVDMFIWLNKTVTIKDYPSWRQQGIFLLGACFAVRSMGGRFSELESVIIALFPNDPNGVDVVRGWVGGAR